MRTSEAGEARTTPATGEPRDRGVTMPLPPPRRTLPALLEHAAEAFGDRPLLRMGEGRWAHRDAARQAADWAARLRAAGVARGDRVAVLSANRLEFLQVFLGCGWLGAVAVPINTAAMGPQIGYYLADSGARLLVLEAEFLPRLAQAGEAVAKLGGIWVIGEADAPVAGMTARGWAEVAEPPMAPAPAAEVGPGDPLALLYTSGTTGPAKGVVCPHAQYLWWGVHSADVLGVRAGDVLATTLPLFHINALNTFAQAAVTGCEVAFLARFSASGFWPTMQECGATVTYLLGAMVPILLAQPVSAAERGHRVRTALGPGVPAAAQRDFLARTGVRLVEGYGSTETNFVIATRADDGSGTGRAGIMGWLREGFEARVADAFDEELPTGEAGELLLRAHEPFVFASGYFGMADKTVEAWRNLWFHTGDRVVREADGAFRFVDRLKDAIRRRGENISSWEVEQVLLAHPAVAACAVYPVRSELAEDEVMAALVPREGASLDLEGLIAFCADRLPYFAVPRYLEPMDDLPRTENGKVQKFRLRERGIGRATWDRGPVGRAAGKG